MDESIRALKTEFSSPAFRALLKEKHGNICANCGSDKRIMYHHIVPILHGGTNKLSNIAPLCPECHGKAHGRYRIGISSGRPLIATLDERTEEIMGRYYNQEIGTEEAKTLLEVKKNVWFRLRVEYENKYGIRHLTGNRINTLDLIAAKQRQHGHIK